MAEVRQRKSKDQEAVDKTAYVRTGLEAITPTKYKKHVQQVAPILVSIWTAAEIALPYLQQAKAKIKEVWEADLVTAIVGLAMVFFGGDFPYLIAAVSAIRVTGTWGTVSRAVKEIYAEMEHVFQESKKDDAKDDDGDGIPDVQQLPSKEVVQRKIILAAKTVDPNKLGLAVTALSTGFLAVLASLKLTFARALTLGSQLGETLAKPGKRYAEPILKNTLDDDFHKWIDPGISYASRFLAMSIAFTVQRLISTVHSAVQGGQLFTSAAARYMNKRGLITFDPEKSNLDEQAGYAIAVVGLYFQIFQGTPLLLSLLLLPVTGLNYIVYLAVTMAN